jgi:hypothetical protein
MSTRKSRTTGSPSTLDLLASEDRKPRANPRSDRRISASQSAPAGKRRKRPFVIGKADHRYWLQPGKLFSDARYGGDLSCKFQMHDRREAFTLRTRNKNIAAVRAAKIYNDVSALGWDAALQKHKPITEKAKAATVGALIEAAIRLSAARPESLSVYAKALRRVAAAAMGLDGGHKYDNTAENREWVAKVDAVSLFQLTPARVMSWKNAFLRAARTPEERNHTIITISTLLRNSKALLSPKILPLLTKEITLPAELWFQGITNEKEPLLNYKVKLVDTRPQRERSMS